MEEINEFVKDFKESMKRINIEIDEECERELRKLLKDFDLPLEFRKKINNLMEFIIRQMIVRPLVKKVMADVQSGKLNLSGD